MRCCIMLFYYDLLDSIIGYMSPLFGIVNSIRLFCILLCNYTFYYVLYFAILTWRFRLLWWRFALSIWQCKVLYPIVQFYILLCTYLCYHPRLGYFRNFCILFCAPVLWSVSSWVVLCLCHILHGTQWTRIRRPSRGMGIVLSHVAIFCHPLLKWLSCFSQKPSAQRIVQNFEAVRVRKWWLGHPGSRAIRTRLSVWSYTPGGILPSRIYRVPPGSYTQLFWCWNCWRKRIEKSTL